MTDPAHLTSVVKPFTTDDPTDAITARCAELQLQGVPFSMARLQAELESELTFERRSDMARRQAMAHIAKQWAELTDEQRRAVAEAISPFA